MRRMRDTAALPRAPDTTGFDYIPAALRALNMRDWVSGCVERYAGMADLRPVERRHSLPSGASSPLCSRAHAAPVNVQRYETSGTDTRGASPLCPAAVASASSSRGAAGAGIITMNAAGRCGRVADSDPQAVHAARALLCFADNGSMPI